MNRIGRRTAAEGRRLSCQALPGRLRACSIAFDRRLRLDGVRVWGDQ
jgi:hypothetical protein